MTSRKSKRLLFKDLYTMRFLAFLALFSMAAFPFANKDAGNSILASFLRFIEGWGYAGIDFFMIVSGFLITVHGLRQYKYYNSFNLRVFTIRRAFKILPLYLFMLILGFIIIPAIIEGLKMNAVELPEWWKFLLFMINFDLANQGVSFVGFMVMPSTIVIYVQLYALMGLLLKYFKSRLKIISVVLIIAGLAFRILDLYSSYNFAFTPMFYFTNIGIGIQLALLVRARRSLFQQMRSLKGSSLKVSYIASGLIIFFGYSITLNTPLSPIMGLLVPYAFAYIIFDQSFGLHSPFQLKKIKFMSEWGKTTYGLFMYHGIIISLLVILWETLKFPANFFLEQVLFPLVALTLTIFVANLSFIIIEKPLLRIRREFKK